MSRLAVCLAGLALCLAPAASAGAHVSRHAPASGHAGAVPGVYAHEQARTLALLRDLDPGTNAVFSPLSIETALAMVDQGASGTTAAQLDHWLGVDTPGGAAAASASLTRAVDRAASGTGGPTVENANSLWVQSGLRVLAPFARTLADSFGATPQQTDFTNPAAAIAAINGQVASATHGLIPSLMGPGQISDATRLVLANAIYLNARWRSPFDPDRTAKAPFHTGGATVSVPFMDSGDLSSYATAQGPDGQAVALPYAHSSLQFLAVMPALGRLAAVERALTPARLAGIAASLHSHAVELFMPKFTLSLHASLNALLQHEGVTQAFGQGSQLNRMVRGQNLFIQAVEHAAVLKVAEKGTVAAAATGISTAPTAVLANSEPLRLDHPFLVFLRDTRTGTILFAARVQNPAGG